MPQLVTIAAGNGANSGRTAQLIGTEVLASEDLAAAGIGPIEIGVVVVDDITRRYALADLAPVSR